jgi:membrane fusion protein (multidrug efflux system)
MTVSLRHEALYTTVALLASAAGGLAVTFGCSRDNTAAAAAPPLEAAVAPVQQKDIPVLREWIGTLDGLVNVVQHPHTEGAFVKGRLPFQIEPRLFQAAVDRTRGQVAPTERQLEQSCAQLAQAQAIAQQDFGETARAQINVGLQKVQEPS